MRALPVSTRVLTLVGAALALTLGLLLVLVLHRSSSAPLAINYHQSPTRHHPIASRAKVHARAAGAAIHARLVHLDRGLPPPLASELASHALVVAVIASPDEAVDATTIVAAADGAHEVGAGFALLNVRNKAIADSVAAFAASAGDPTILIVRQPGTIAAQFSGYQDPTTVAQAIVDLR